MPLESLLQFVDKLRGRIQQHASLLRQNEALTRSVLIEPLLRELGWDTENPDQVRPEYRSGSGRADYALMNAGKPVLMIEAKPLDTSLQDGLMQGINYCITEGTPYFTVTDGRRWEIYQPHKQAPLADKRVVAFDLGGEASSEAVLQALVLWRPNLETAQITLPRPPLVTWPAQRPPAGPVMGPPALTRAQTAASRTSMATPPTVLSPTPFTGRTSLSQLHQKKHDSPPTALRLADGAEVAIRRWVDVPVSVAQWLVDKGILTAARCPIQQGSRYLVNVTPSHPGGKPFTQPKSVDPLYLEANYNGADQVRNTVLILRHLGQDPDKFSVRF